MPRPLLTATAATLFVLALACGAKDDAASDAPASPTTTTSTSMSGSGTKADPYVATCSSRGKELAGNAGDSFYLSCPEGCTTGSLWGTGPYTRDSSICTAAVHAGAVGSGGGLVKASILAGQDSYGESEANGVSSHSWGAYDSSLGVEPGEAKAATPAAPSKASEPADATPKTTTPASGARPMVRPNKRGH